VDIKRNGDIVRQDEEIYIYRFVVAYEFKYKQVLKVVEKNRERPDFSVRINKTGELIGVEVTGIFQNEEEAKIMWGKYKNWNKFTGDNEELINELQRIIYKKIEKVLEYDFDGRIFLVIFLGSIVFNEWADACYLHKYLNIPFNKFERIYLLVKEKTTENPELYPLYMS
jgi:hypothetical protein